MGNHSTKESRNPDALSAAASSHRHADGSPAGAPASSADRHHPDSSGHTARGSHLNLSVLGIGSSSRSSDAPDRRETKQEREARRLERERAARVEERERSLKEEHVDGGYLVTMGVYTGVEDFNKPIVRQLMIERRMAPFWRGLDDFNPGWTEHQLVAAGRGLPIPAADEIPPPPPPPPEALARPTTLESPHTSSHNIDSLTVPMSSRSPSAASDASANLSPSHPACSNASPATTTASPPHAASPFRPRSKTFASLTSASKSLAASEIVPREMQLPMDPYVNGQAIEVFLYKNADDCPICFLSYPPYLNKTRCCDQAICSECFVQIKRPDPHPPEHHDPSNPAPPSTENVDPEQLVSEPACCPYCQQPEFGVTYDHPPFRRGLSYANAPHGLGSFGSAMSSQSSLLAAPVSPGPLSPGAHKRRTTISATASTVITTDRVRPDWSTKLQAARQHLARRSAAATALHTAAYLIGTNAPEQRGLRGRFGRSRGENSAGTSGAATPTSAAAIDEGGGARTIPEQLNLMRSEGPGPGERRRSRMDDLEDMMMMEAIRLSLAAEEERKKKAEKEAAKEAKKKAKEDKKREKKEKKGVYGSGASSASGSTLSLGLPGMGRRRAHSGASNLQRQITHEGTEPPTSKGKGVDRGSAPLGRESPSSASAPIDVTHPAGSANPGPRHLDTAAPAALHDSHRGGVSPTAPDRPSHLRQMSNASSPSSSFVESASGSLRDHRHKHGSSSTIDSPNASGTNIGGQSGGTPDMGDADGGAGPESMFNFHSLAARIGSEDNKDDRDAAAKHIEYLADAGESSKHGTPADAIPSAPLEESVATLKVDTYVDRAATNEVARQTTVLEPQSTTPEVMVTPETPAASHVGDDDGKQLGANWTNAREITQ